MRTLVRSLHGSRLYGTATAGSDHDYKSVHVPSAEDVLLQATRPVVTRSTGTQASRNASDDIDDESFALHKYMRMLREGDTIAVELLFAPDAMLGETTPEWNEIRRHRSRLVNSKCQGFVGYCRNQAGKYSVKGDRLACARAALELVGTAIAEHGPKARLAVAADAIAAHVAAHPDAAAIVDIPHVDGRPHPHWEVCNRKTPYTIVLKDAAALIGRTVDEYGSRARKAEVAGGVDWKAVSHAMRVAFQARELLSTGWLTLPRPADEARLLTSVKLGRVPYAEIGPRLDPLLADVERAAAASVLPAESDVGLMDAIVVDLYGKAGRRTAVRGTATASADAIAAVAADPRAILRLAAEASEGTAPPDADLVAAMASRASGLRSVPPDEVRQGLFRVLEGRRPSRGFRMLNAVGALDVVLPELAAADGLRQNDYHLHDVFGHVMAAIDASASQGDGIAQRVAVLLHDIAKPSTATPRPDGRGNRFHGHEVVGAVMADAILKRLGVDDALRKRTTTLVREHMYPTRNAHGAVGDDAGIRRLIARVGPDLLEPLMSLRRCDILAKGFDHEAILARDEAYAMRVRAMALVDRGPRIADLPVDGRDVIAAMVASGLKPPGYRGGPEVRALLQEMIPTAVGRPPPERATMMRYMARTLSRRAREAGLRPPTPGRAAKASMER